MSTPPPTDPKNPNDATKKEMTTAIVWAVLSAVFAAIMYKQADKVEASKQSFYLLAAALGGVVTFVNGYSAWTLYQKSKQPPATPK
jgi:hypothetical protein